MYYPEYAKRLEKFNSSDKYHKELKFLFGLLSIKPEGLRVLDYGYGIGTAMKYLSPYCIIRGYDVNNFQADIPVDLIDNGQEKYDRIFFMHSFAHIPDIEKVLNNLICNRLVKGGKIVVITPNKTWLRIKNGGQDKKSDDTVIEHFTKESLFDIFNKAGLRCIIGGFSANSSDTIQQEKEFIYERIYCVASFV